MEASEEFDPQNCSQSIEQKPWRPKQERNYVSGKNNGKWSEKQNTQYIVFIEFHKETMRSKEKRRVNKLYKEMSRFIGTRNALQCRSHHQKLSQRYLYPNKIISYYKQHNDLALYNKTKLELQIFEAKDNANPSSRVKLQEEVLSHPTEGYLRAAETNSANQSPEASNMEAAADNSVLSWSPNAHQMMTMQFCQVVDSWGQLLYYPIYRIC